MNGWHKLEVRFFPLFQKLLSSKKAAVTVKKKRKKLQIYCPNDKS